MSEIIYLLALHKVWLNHKDLFNIFENTRNFKDFWEILSFSSLKKHNISDSKIENILKYKNKINLENIEKKVKDLNIKIIIYGDENYPENLKHIFNPPFLIYYRWDIFSESIAFVWARDMTDYGKKVIEKFVPEVWKYFSIISGWALGCDYYSHKIALKNNIKTISVFWTGIDIFYPSFNRKLFVEILEKWWWLISTFPLSEPGRAYNFPIRNEIVAWLSSGVVIVEAKEKSGSLITASLALDLWKELFSVPWNIFNLYSTWTNNLILNWQAKAFTKASDFFEEYNISAKEKEEKIIKFNDEFEEKIYKLLLKEALNIDELSEKLSINVRELSLKISLMELSLIIKKSSNWKYEII